jgi:hypothetical protein
MPFSISGNVVAVNAKLSLFSVRQTSGQTPITVFSDASGNFTFTNVAAGDYRLVADCSSANAPHNTGYSYRQQKSVSVTTSAVTDLNFSPTLLTASNS